MFEVGLLYEVPLFDNLKRFNDIHSNNWCSKVGLLYEVPLFDKLKCLTSIFNVLGVHFLVKYFPALNQFSSVKNKVVNAEHNKFCLEFYSLNWGKYMIFWGKSLFFGGKGGKYNKLNGLFMPIFYFFHRSSKT